LRYKETWDNKISFCILCRKYPQLADQRSDSNLFVGKVVDRRNTLLSHQMSSKHQACQMRGIAKCKQGTGDMDRALAKVNQAEVEWYEKLFNTAYAVAKHNRPFTEYNFLCEVQIKNGVQLGNDHLSRDACVDFIKAISEVLSEEIKNQMKQVRFISILWEQIHQVQNKKQYY
jgi:hypothetical protein